MIRKIVVLTFVFVSFQNCSQDADFRSATRPSDVARTQGSDVVGSLPVDEIDNSDSGPENEPPVVVPEEPEQPVPPVVVTPEPPEMQEPPITEIVQNCENLTQQTHATQITFNPPGKTCEWNQNGNLGKFDRYFQARIEQSQNLNLPAGALVCGASFDFVQQDFRYDDQFLFLFNDNLIASGYNFESLLETGNQGLLKYDWNRIRVTEWFHGVDGGLSLEEIYCPQIPGGTAQCDFPGHDQQGTIHLNYSDSFIQSLMAQGVPQNHSFKLVTLGDDDKHDCEHTGVSFTVTVKYVVPQLITDSN